MHQLQNLIFDITDLELDVENLISNNNDYDNKTISNDIIAHSSGTEIILNDDEEDGNILAI